MVEVRVICAIGKHGQLGLNGRLPWEGRRDLLYLGMTSSDSLR